MARATKATQLEIPRIKSKDIIGYQNVAVVTTRMLADYYGTEARNIRFNFDYNKEWFAEGESYFKMEGEELKNFRKDTRNSGVFSGGTGSILYLWTEEGALLHSKMINTREAWQIHKMLVANYFEAHTRRRNRESARKVRENVDWYKTRRIGIDDGRIPLTDTIEMFHTMYMRQKREKGEGSMQPLATFCRNFTRTGYVYAFINYSYATKADDLPDGVVLRDMFSQDELRHVMTIEKKMRRLVGKEVGLSTDYKDADKHIKAGLVEFVETHKPIMCQALPKPLAA